MKRKLLSLILVMSMLLSACGSAEEKTEQTDKTAQTATETAEATDEKRMRHGRYTGICAEAILSRGTALPRLT